MSTIHIKRRHRLSREEARARVDRVAKDLKSQLDADYTWQGDTLQFKRSGASGCIDVGSDAIELKIKLGLLLSPLKSAIEESIRKNLDLALAEHGSGRSNA